MSSAELKLKIFRQIDALDKSKIEAFYGHMLNFLNSDADTAAWKALSSEEQSGILSAVHQLDKGEALSHESVMKQARKKRMNG